MNAKAINRILKPGPARWPFQHHKAAWSTTLTLLLLGFLLSAGAAQDYPNPNHPIDANVSLGATVKFQAYVSTAYFPPTFQWQHEGTNLPGATSVPLVLTNVTVADAGSYRALIWNAIGEATNTRTATLTVDTTFTKIMTGVIATDSEPSFTPNWADYNNDGYVDLYVANYAGGGTRGTLYHNNGGTNFTRANAGSVSTDVMNVWFAAWADYDNDGNVDLIAANLNGGLLAQRLYRNNGDGTFTAVVDSALRSDTAAAARPWWFDYDNDGFLDLFVTKGIGNTPANDCLFRNNGDGTFKKMTVAEVGPIVDDRMPTDFCYSVDYNDDGRQELAVFQNVNSDYSTVTWSFQDNGTFVPLPTAPPNGLAWGDFDNDGWLDTFGTVGSEPNFFRNLGAGGFTNTSINSTTPLVAGVSDWGDYDNDGWLDLFFSGIYWTSSLNGLFRNNRDGTFTQILAGSPVYDADRQWAPAWADYDNDGFLDLFIAAGDGEPRKNLLYRNNGNTNHWLKVKLDGRASNRSGVGAKVRAQATINGRTFWQVREILCGSGEGGSGGLVAHFGLGDATNVTKLRIEWPSGIVQERENVSTNQFITVVESQSYPGAAPEFTGVTNSTAGLQLSFLEPEAGLRYTLEASTNLLSWTKLMARTSTNGTAHFTDPRATNYTSRFYRLLVP